MDCSRLLFQLSLLGLQIFRRKSVRSAYLFSSSRVILVCQSSDSPFSIVPPRKIEYSIGYCGIGGFLSVGLKTFTISLNVKNPTPLERGILNLMFITWIDPSFLDLCVLVQAHPFFQQPVQSLAVRVLLRDFYLSRCLKAA